MYQLFQKKLKKGGEKMDALIRIKSLSDALVGLFWKKVNLNKKLIMAKSPSTIRNIELEIQEVESRMIQLEEELLHIQ